MEQVIDTIAINVAKHLKDLNDEISDLKNSGKYIVFPKIDKKHPLCYIEL